MPRTSGGFALDCGDISWLAAWDLWWADQVVADCRLYGGWTIRTWGRIGKVMLFLSAWTLVVDLIGYRRLRLVGLIWRRQAIVWRLALSRRQIFATGVRRKSSNMVLRWSAFYLRRWLPLIILATLALAAFMFGVDLYFGKDWRRAADGPLLIFWVLLIWPPILFVALPFLAALMLRHRRLREAIQIGAFAFLVLGFAFDLLAS